MTLIGQESVARTVGWSDATWRFSSAENLDSFKLNPQAWRIHDGKLYLNYSKGVLKTWAQDVPGNIAKADTNWPKVLDK